MKLSKDYFLDGKIIVFQPEKGFRFSIDAPILADFIEIKNANSRLLEIGGGCGIISLILSKTKSFGRLYIIEIQEEMIMAMKKNIKENKIKNPINLVWADFKTPPFKKDSFDIIFSNPPYLKKNRGKLPYDSNKAISKFELELDMETVILNSYKLLKERGTLYLIYPFERAKELKEKIIKHGFFLRRERFVLPRANRKPVFYMIEAGKIAFEEIISDFIILENENGEYRQEIENILRGRNVYN